MISVSGLTLKFSKHLPTILKIKFKVVLNELRKLFGGGEDGGGGRREK
jgi:hypothetical protein